MTVGFCWIQGLIYLQLIIPQVMSVNSVRKKVNQGKDKIKKRNVHVYNSVLPCYEEILFCKKF